MHQVIGEFHHPILSLWPCGQLGRLDEIRSGSVLYLLPGPAKCHHWYNNGFCIVNIYYLNIA